MLGRLGLSVGFLCEVELKLDLVAVFMEFDLEGGLAT